MPLSLTGGHWPAEWRPIGFGSPALEPFANWWHRNATQFPNLAPLVCEQWIYRHWTSSPYFGLQVRRLRCSRERYPTNTFLLECGSILASRSKGPFVVDAGHIFKAFRRAHEPARTMGATGTWNIPVVLLRSSDGFELRGRPIPEHHLWLIEGHRRLRYLSALSQVERAANAHDAYVLELVGAV